MQWDRVLRLHQLTKIMNFQEMLQAADFAAEMLQAGTEAKSLVHVVYHPDFEQGLLGLSSPLAHDSDLSGLTNRYYTLNELIELGLLQHKVEALDFYAEELKLPSRAEIKGWLHSGENHKVAEALIALSWSYASYPAISYCRKHRSQW